MGSAGGGLNGSLWTVSSEVSFYLLVPIFYVIARRFGFRWLLALLAVMGAGGLVLENYVYVHPVLGMGDQIFYFNMPPWLDHVRIAHAVTHVTPLIHRPVIGHDALVVSGWFGPAFALLTRTFIPYLYLFGLGIFWSYLWVRANQRW